MITERDFWNHRSHNYDEQIGPLYERAYQLTAERTLAYLKPEDRVLDFACGTGIVTLEEAPHVKYVRAIDISDEIECGPHLDEDLIEAEDDSGAFKLLLETEEDVVTLEESRYMISRPLCLCAESADLLEQGLRVFPGLALYDGTWEQEDAVISYFETKYGMIRL